MGHPYILYIEDERKVVDLVKRALENTGYEIVGALSGESGLKMIRQRKPDLVLLDLMMPGIDGFEVYRRMKADPSLADVPIIVITATIPESGNVIVEGLPPVDDYITKPFKLSRLTRAIQDILKQFFLITF